MYKLSIAPEASFNVLLADGTKQMVLKLYESVPHCSKVGFFSSLYVLYKRNIRTEKPFIRREAAMRGQHPIVVDNRTTPRRSCSLPASAYITLINLYVAYILDL